MKPSFVSLFPFLIVLYALELSAVTDSSIIPEASREFKQCSENRSVCTQQCQQNASPNSCIEACDSTAHNCIDLVESKYIKLSQTAKPELVKPPEPVATGTISSLSDRTEVYTRIDQQGYGDNMGCTDQPRTEQGRPCLNLALGRSETITLDIDADGNACEPACKDTRYFYAAKNICSIPLRVVYKWAASNLPNKSYSSHLPANSEIELDCLKNGDGCAGQLEWNYCEG